MDKKDFSEWSREKKEEYAAKKMEEMRLKNQELQKRHAEVECDRIEAESKNSSVTNSTKTPKEEKISYDDKGRKKDEVKYMREWDKGKGEDGDWKTHNHKAFKDYIPSSFDRMNDKKDEKNYRIFDSNNKSRNSRVRHMHEASTSWNGSNEDNNKYTRTHNWVVSMRNSSGKQDSNSAERDTRNKSPKKKYEQCNTGSAKCLNQNYVPNSGKDKSKQVKSQKLDFRKTNSPRKSMIMQEKLSEEKKNRSHYSKFDRFDHSAENSEDSNFSDQYDPLYKKKSEENNNSDEVQSNKNFKSVYPGSEESKDQSTVPFNFDRKSLSCKEVYSAKKCSNNPGSNATRKVSRHNASQNFPKEMTYNRKEFNSVNDEKIPKKGSKTKRSPHCNSPDSSKNDQISKQRRFDKGHSENESWNNSAKDMKYDKFHSIKKKSNFNDINSQYGWGNDEDDSECAKQSGKSWNISEDNEEKSKFLSDTQDTYINDNIVSKKEKKFKVRSPTASDDGGWSTVEEGEIQSDDDLEEGKKKF